MEPNGYVRGRDRYEVGDTGLKRTRAEVENAVSYNFREA